MPKEYTRFVIKLSPHAPDSIVDLFPSPHGEYVSVRDTNPTRQFTRPVNMVLYHHNGSYVPVQWKVHEDFTHLQLYWYIESRPPIKQLESGERISIIRPVFRTLFWCMIQLQRLLRRTRLRLLIKKALSRQSAPNTLSLFSGHVNYPIQCGILECI
jgi:hypothetical protein